MKYPYSHWTDGEWHTIDPSDFGVSMSTFRSGIHRWAKANGWHLITGSGDSNDIEFIFLRTPGDPLPIQADKWVVVAEDSFSRTETLYSPPSARLSHDLGFFKIRTQVDGKTKWGLRLAVPSDVLDAGTQRLTVWMDIQVENFNEDFRDYPLNPDGSYITLGL